VGKSDVKFQFGRPWHRWEDNKVGFWEVGCRSMDWIDLDRRRAVVNAVMNLRVA
jgi:hypothetical protein